MDGRVRSFVVAAAVGVLDAVARGGEVVVFGIARAVVVDFALLAGTGVTVGGSGVGV